MLILLHNSQNKQTQPHLMRDKALAEQPRPVQGILAFLDPLLGPAATVVTVNHPLGSCAPVGQDETDSRKEFAAMPVPPKNSIQPVRELVGAGSGCESE